MAKYTVKHSCGCKREYQLFGKLTERERKLELLETRPCLDCKRKAEEAEAQMRLRLLYSETLSETSCNVANTIQGRFIDALFSENAVSYNKKCLSILTSKNRFKKGQTVWTKFQIIDTEPNENGFYVLKDCLKQTRYILPDELYTTEEVCKEQSTQVDNNRFYKKGDKVRLIERDGRIPFIHDTLSYKIGGIYEIVDDEEVSPESGYSVRLKNPNPGKMDEPFPFYHLELVEPVAEPNVKS